MSTDRYQISAQTNYRGEKGKNLLLLPDTYVVIDVETTGLSPEYGDIIEFGALKVVDGVFAGTFSSLVNPGYKIRPKITEITGITNSLLAPAPRIADVLPEFLRFTADNIVIGHNVNFDIRFVHSACLDVLQVSFRNNFVDTMRLSRRLFPHEKRHRLCDLVERFNIEAEIFHRALADVRLTDSCYRYMKDYMGQNNIHISALAPERPTPESSDRNIVTTQCAGGLDVCSKVFVFTGKLIRLTRAQAVELVTSRGGLCANSVNKHTDYLVLGTNSPTTQTVGRKSSKRLKAEQLQQAGCEIQIITENVFYQMMG